MKWNQFFQILYMKKAWESPIFWLLLPAAIITFFGYNYAKEHLIKANAFLIFMSALVPILGVICWFARQDVDRKSANIYLICAGISFGIGMIGMLFL